MRPVIILLIIFFCMLLASYPLVQLDKIIFGPGDYWLASVVELIVFGVGLFVGFTVREVSI